MKLQIKLALYNAISKAIIVLAIGFLLPLLIRQVVYNHMDNRLKARLEKTFLMIQRGGLDEIALDQDCSFESFNVFKEEYLAISPLSELPPNSEKPKIENSARVIDNEQVNHRVLSMAFMYDNQLYNLEIGEGLSTVEQLNSTIRNFTLLMLGLVVIISIFLDLAFGRVLLRPFNKIVNWKLKDVQHPSSFDPSPVKTNTYEFSYLDRSINEMMHKINEAFQIEREFITNVSHELLTPVSILKNRLENMLSEPNLPAPVAERLVESQKTLSRLTKIVKALLYISKIENRQFIRNETADLRTAIHEVLEELEERIQEKNITVRQDWKNQLSFYPCNKSLLHTLFFNILSNAVKYNKEGGMIRIEAANVDDNFQIRIQDTGSGISAEHIPYIFDRFKRFRPEDDVSYGLGLPIVQTIAAFHDIKVTAESKPGNGTTFIVSFPQSRA